MSKGIVSAVAEVLRWGIEFMISIANEDSETMYGHSRNMAEAVISKSFHR